MFFPGDTLESFLARNGPGRMDYPPLPFYESPRYQYRLPGERVWEFEERLAAFHTKRYAPVQSQVPWPFGGKWALSRLGILFRLDAPADFQVGYPAFIPFFILVRNLAPNVSEHCPRAPIGVTPGYLECLFVVRDLPAPARIIIWRFL